MTPDEQPKQISEGDERTEDVAEEENRMEVNCNGHSCTPESERTVEPQGTNQSTEEDEDQQNANQQKSNTETDDALSNKEEHHTCNGTPGDANPQQLPASLAPDSVTVELKEGEKEGEKMDTRGDTKREEKDGQNG